MLRRLIDAVPVLISYVDTEGRYRFNNAAYEDWFGIRQEEIRGLHLREVLGEATYRHIAPHIATALSGQRVSFEAGLPYGRGGRRYVSVEYVPDIGPDGAVRGLFALISDLTDRRRSEQEIRRLNAELGRRLDELQAIFDAAPIGIFVGRDAACRDMVANRAGARMLRVQEGANPSKSGPQAQALPFNVFSGDRELAPEELPMQRAAATGHVIKDQEIQVRFPNGSETILSTHSAPLYDEQGKVRGCVGTFVDVTERRRIELALAEMDRRKDMFLAVLAHELRNPLAALQHALDVAETSGVRDHVMDILKRQTSHLTRLVDDLLDVARITKGRVNVQLEPVRFGTLLREAIAALGPGLADRRQQLVLDLDSADPWIAGDAVRLTQVITNLVTNASKYSPEGATVKVSLSVEPDAVVLVVEDEGTGIAPSELPYVFDPFVQAGVPTGRSDAGLGLGLTLVKQLTVLHGGTVEAYSEGPGRGSRFVVRLPLARLSAEETVPQSAKTGPADQLKGRRVLVVEDNRDVADSLQQLLSACGAEVRCVYLGGEAARAVTAFAPEVVLLDIGMPDIDGREVARELTALDGRERILVIAISGHAKPSGHAEHPGRPLFDAVLPKPVSIDALCELLGRLQNR
jgi:PAS domain S-box-containing protein